MPINAGAVGIQPLGPQRPASGIDGVQRRNDGTSGGFRPQTEVSLKTAIDDIAATLGRIAAQEKFGVERLPSNIGQVVRNILQQSLSMEETLAQGIGSTIESQRFSTEQLSIFARMLAQIGALAEKGFSMELSDETKALLTQFKNLIVASEGGRAFEPVLMSKAAFELVDSKTPEQLPPALLEMFTQPGQSSEPAQFLRQLVDLLMPKPRADGNSAQVQQQGAAQQESARPTAMQQRLNVTYRQFDAPYSQTNQSAPVQNNAAPNSPAQTSQPVQQPAAGQSQVSEPVSNQPATANIQQPVQNNAVQNSPASPAQQNFSTANQQPSAGQTPSPTPVQTQAPPATANISNQPAAEQTANFSAQNSSAQSTPTANIQAPTAEQSPVSDNRVLQSPASNHQAPPATANQSAPLQNNAAPNSKAQISQPVQQPAAGQTPNVSNQPMTASQPTTAQGQSQPAPLQTSNNQPTAAVAEKDSPVSQPPVSNQQAQPSTANQPAIGQTANQPAANIPTPNQPANQQPVAQNFSTTNQPAQPTPTANQPAPQPANIQNQPAQPTPTANQSTPLQTPNIQNQPAQSTPTANQQPANQQPAATVPRDDFSINLPKKPQTSPVDEDFIARQRELMAQMQFAKTQLLQQPIQNTPQTTDALKNLAQFLMRNPASAESMSQRETTLLQNFVNNQQTVLPRDEARHLQNLLRLCQQNVPAVVQQAAAQHKLPDLPRLWAFMQLCDMASLPAHMPALALKRAAREVSDFSNAIRQSMSGDNTTVQNQRSFQMMLPLYLGENISSYPTYLSVYDETARDKDTGVEKKETWLRICVLTDNIGAAELIFRVYEKTQLDMRFYFSEGEVAEDFKSYVASLRDFIGGTNFSIGEIRIGSIGEKMLLAQ